MMRLSKHHPICLLATVSLYSAILGLMFAPALSFSQTSNQTLQAWQAKFNRVVPNAFFQRSTASNTSNISTVEELATVADNVENITQANNAIVLIYKHISLIKDDMFNPAVMRLHSFLLTYNQWVLSQQLIDAAAVEGSQEVHDVLQYQRAKHYARTQQWQSLLTTLTLIENELSLSPDDQQYAKLLFGIALQHVKKHREAIKIYESIAKDSPYVKQALLNTATAFIRQGWWTDAQLAIDKARSLSSTQEDNEFINRLHVVLGYSQLQNEFYSDARKSFRKVVLGSQYETRALLGIGIAALSQEDFPGALNAFTRIKNRAQLSLSGLEAFLLVPYTQVQMGDQENARQNYNQAILFFDQAVLQLQSDPNQLINDNDFNTNHISLEKNAIAIIEDLLASSLLPKTKQQLSELLSIIKSYHEQLQKNQVEQTISHIRSYISQCEYGLASLYDSTK